MCGRYDLSQNPAAVKAHFRVPAVPDFDPSVDVRPTETKPIVRLDRDRVAREAVLARWGLVPWWASDIKFGARCINARAESVTSTPAFRDAYRQRRCLVPVNAFYEWSGPKGQRRKWRLRVVDADLFALAGLWEWWREPGAAQGLESYTIVTCAANDAIAPLHDRMPVIVDPPNYDRWLDASTDAADLMTPMASARIAIDPS